MAQNLKQVVSMVAGENKIMLICVTGEVCDMKNDGPHDTTKISEFLTPKLTGTDVVEIDLNDYLALSTALKAPDYEEEGLKIEYEIDGKMVQGIFYPQKVDVSVMLDDEKVTIPKVEKLEKHIRRAVDENSPSVRNFLRRMAKVAKDRLHSAEDLMDFIERSELPLTNDGRIIGYKRVKVKEGGKFVDCHSGKVEQQVGSRVWMEADKVDPNRNQSCSNGLHVANLGYLRGFSGTHTLIVIVDPEDFIAVPHGETNKCRVCAYDVIGVMSRDAQDIVNQGDHVEGDTKLQDLISAAVQGNHIKPFETVKVGHKAMLEVLPIVDDLSGEPGDNVVPIEPAVAETKKASGKSLNTDQEKRKKDVVKVTKQAKAAAQGKTIWDTAPKEVLAVFADMQAGQLSKSAIAAKHNTSTRTMGRWSDKYDYEGWVAAQTANETVPQKARRLFNEWRAGVTQAFDALVEFKKARKKGWKALGFSAKEVTQIEKALS